jgi:hypothetical protein
MSSDPKGALTTLVWPELLNSGEKTTFGMQDYRNKLCSLIQCPVKGAVIEPDETIRIYFDNGVEMRIPLQSYRYSGKRAILTGPQDYLLVF